MRKGKEPARLVRIGERFGNLTVVAPSDRFDCVTGFSICKCNCGNDRRVYNRYLLQGRATHCGCLRRKGPYLAVGDRFGFLTVESLLATSNNQNGFCVCRCDCGTVKEYKVRHLIDGATTSCACGRKSREDIMSFKPPNGGRCSSLWPGYAATEDGRLFYLARGGVWNEALGYLNPKTGYRQVTLTRNGKYEHRLIHSVILEILTDSKPEGMFALHKNGDKLDCRLDNLYWGTREQNAADSIVHGTMPVGEKCHFSKLKESDIVEIFALRASGVSTASIAEKFSVSEPSICSIILRKTWKHVNISENILIDARKMYGKRGSKNVLG